MNDNSIKNLDKKDKIIIGLIVSIFILLIIILVGVLVTGKKANESNNGGGNVETENNNVSQVKTEFDIRLEEQYKDILKQYFGMEALNLYNYENLARYPSAYKDTMINIQVYVEKVLEEKDNNYKMLVGMIGGTSDNGEYFVIEGKYDKTRYLKGDSLSIYGVYKGNETYNIDGKTNVLPKINAVKIVVGSATGAFHEYTQDYIRKVAEAFFQTPFTLTKPNYNYQDEVELELMQLPFHYLVRIDNNSNARFNTYRIYTEYPVISVATEKESMDLRRYIDKSSDGKKFILSTYTKSNDYLELQLYDKDFKLIWTRQFENAKDYIYDINNGKISLIIDGELYIIDESTGNDIISPVMVANASCIKLLKNGEIILVTQSAKNFIIYFNADGTIKWKTSLSTYNGEHTNEIYGVYSIIIANDKIYVGFDMTKDADTVAVFDKNGEELVNTFAHPNG